MKKSLILTLLIALGIMPIACSKNSDPAAPAPVTVVQSPAGPTTLVLDNFNGPSVDTLLTWTDPIGDVTPSFTNGQMVVNTPDNRGYWYTENYNAPRLGRTVTGDFLMQTKFTRAPCVDLCHTARLLALIDAVAPVFITTSVHGNDTFSHGSYGTTPVVSEYSGATLPNNNTYWMRLVRSGNVFTSYYSIDGLNWTSLYAETISTAPSSIWIGLLIPNSSSWNFSAPSVDYLLIQQ